MDLLDFFDAIRMDIESENRCCTSPQIAINNFFFNAFKQLTQDNVTAPLLTMTRGMILFEGFYQNHLMTNVGALRWKHHFGVPTLNFLLSYRRHIEETQAVLNGYGDGEHSQWTPWMIHQEEHLVVDSLNNVLVDPNSVFQVDVPLHFEMTGTFTKTHNPLGGHTTTPSDPISQCFIQPAREISHLGGQVLEIGAAFGVATLAAIATGATVYCNDIDVRNLAVVRQRYLASISEQQSMSVTGDDSQLILVPGALPHELLGLPRRFFDAILICRVLHFFTGEKIDESLQLMSTLLAPGGKIYIVCETPFLKNWDSFIPELNKRIELGVEWPGEITNTDEFDRSGRETTSCKFIHWITKEVLERSMLRAGFNLEQVTYINRVGQFPESLLRPEEGRESVGAIGVFNA